MTLNTKGFKSISLFAAIALLTANCDYVKDMNYQVTPDPLEMHGDSVKVKVEIQIPEKSFNKKVYAELQPSFGAAKLKPITIVGEKATANGVVVPFKPGKTVVFSDVVAYDESMRNADLYVEGQIFKKGIQRGEIEKQTLAHGTILTPYLVDIGFGPGKTSENSNSRWSSSAAVNDCDGSKKSNVNRSGSGNSSKDSGFEGSDSKGSGPNASGFYAEMVKTSASTNGNEGNGNGEGYRVISAKDKFERTTAKEQVSQINYLKGRYEVRRSELKDADIVSLAEFLTNAASNERIELTSIDITAFASIEGEEDRNNTLSNNRSNSAKDATMKLASKKDVKNEFAQDESNYSTVGRGEDFEGFKKSLAESEMEESEKRAIMTILEMQKSPEAREQAIRDLNTYLYLDNNIFPAQRRSEITVKYNEVGYSDEELVALSKTNLNELTLEELLRAATLVSSDEDKIRIYKNAESRFPNDYRASNNLGVVYYENGQMDQAKSQFEKAALIEDNKIVKNNLAVIAAQEGDLEKAHMLLDEANGAGSEVSYNRAIINVIEGDYSDAVTNFGSESTYNKALSQILDGDVDGGIRTIDQAPSAECGYGEYLKAIAYARKNDLANVVKNLERAIKINPSLREAAATDAEFRKFFEEDAFKNVIK